MKYVWMLLFSFSLLAPHIVIAASEQNTAIDSAFQFQNWCKKISYRHFSRKKQKAYNWSASTIRQLNEYQTHGYWYVDGIEKEIFCRIRKGKKAKWAKYNIK